MKKQYCTLQGNEACNVEKDCPVYNEKWKYILHHAFAGISYHLTSQLFIESYLFICDISLQFNCVSFYFVA